MLRVLVRMRERMVELGVRETALVVRPREGGSAASPPANSYNDGRIPPQPPTEPTDPPVRHFI